MPKDALSVDVSDGPTDRAGGFAGCILDVDGVLLASPHEQAWREALQGLADPNGFTSAMYQAQVAGRPRQDGALAALLALKVADAAEEAIAYAQRKQTRLEALVRDGAVKAFPDGLRFVEALLGLGVKLAAASSSKNANAMLRTVVLSSGRSLLDVFDANLCGRDLPRGKPDPMIFLIAAAELRIAPAAVFVVEDASAGITAARAGGLAALGVARAHDESAMREAGADLVVSTLDQVDMQALPKGLLRRKANP